MTRPSQVVPLALLVGCYTYRPLATPVPEAGASVDVELNDLGMRDLAGEVGPNIDHVQGRVVRADSSDLELSVTGVQNIRGEPTEWNGERLRLPMRYVQGVEERRLSGAGTGLLGGAVAAGLVAAYRLLGGPGSGAGPSGHSPGGAGQ